MLVGGWITPKEGTPGLRPSLGVHEKPSRLVMMTGAKIGTRKSILILTGRQRSGKNLEVYVYEFIYMTPGNNPYHSI